MTGYDIHAACLLALGRTYRALDSISNEFAQTNEKQWLRTVISSRLNEIDRALLYISQHARRLNAAETASDNTDTVTTVYDALNTARTELSGTEDPGTVVKNANAQCAEIARKAVGIVAEATGVPTNRIDGAKVTDDVLTAPEIVEIHSWLKGFAAQTANV